jgi:hypothetical protein
MILLESNNVNHRPSKTRPMSLLSPPVATMRTTSTPTTTTTTTTSAALIGQCHVSFHSCGALHPSSPPPSSSSSKKNHPTMCPNSNCSTTDDNNIHNNNVVTLDTIALHESLSHLQIFIHDHEHENDSYDDNESDGKCNEREYTDQPTAQCSYDDIHSNNRYVRKTNPRSHGCHERNVVSMNATTAIPSSSNVTDEANTQQTILAGRPIHTERVSCSTTSTTTVQRRRHHRIKRGESVRGLLLTTATTTIPVSPNDTPSTTTSTIVEEVESGGSSTVYDNDGSIHRLVVPQRSWGRGIEHNSKTPISTATSGTTRNNNNNNNNNNTTTTTTKAALSMRRQLIQRGESVRGLVVAVVAVDQPEDSNTATTASRTGLLLEKTESILEESSHSEDDVLGDHMDRNTCTSSGTEPENCPVDKFLNGSMAEVSKIAFDIRNEERVSREKNMLKTKQHSSRTLRNSTDRPLATSMSYREYRRALIRTVSSTGTTVVMEEKRKCYNSVNDPISTEKIKPNIDQVSWTTETDSCSIEKVQITDRGSEIAKRLLPSAISTMDVYSDDESHHFQVLQPPRNKVIRNEVPGDDSIPNNSHGDWLSTVQSVVQSNMDANNTEDQTPLSPQRTMIHSEKEPVVTSRRDESVRHLIPFEELMASVNLAADSLLFPEYTYSPNSTSALSSIGHASQLFDFNYDKDIGEDYIIAVDDVSRTLVPAATVDIYEDHSEWDDNVYVETPYEIKFVPTETKLTCTEDFPIEYRQEEETKISIASTTTIPCTETIPNHRVPSTFGSIVFKNPYPKLTLQDVVASPMSVKSVPMQKSIFEHNATTANLCMIPPLMEDEKTISLSSSYSRLSYGRRGRPSTTTTRKISNDPIIHQAKPVGSNRSSGLNFQSLFRRKKENLVTSEVTASTSTTTISTSVTTSSTVGTGSNDTTTISSIDPIGIVKTRRKHRKKSRRIVSETSDTLFEL